LPFGICACYLCTFSFWLASFGPYTALASAIWWIRVCLAGQFNFFFFKVNFFNLKIFFYFFQVILMCWYKINSNTLKKNRKMVRPSEPTTIKKTDFLLNFEFFLFKNFWIVLIYWCKKLILKKLKNIILIYFQKKQLFPHPDKKRKRMKQEIPQNNNNNNKKK
jgi:hypothetical protein